MTARCTAPGSRPAGLLDPPPHVLKEQASCCVDSTDNITARNGYVTFSMQTH